MVFPQSVIMEMVYTDAGYAELNGPRVIIFLLYFSYYKLHIDTIALCYYVLWSFTKQEL